MDYRQLSRVLGYLLLLMAIAMAGCLVYSLFDNEANHCADRALGVSALFTAAVGWLLALLGRGGGHEILRREAIAIVGLGWMISTLFGALPYVLCTPSLSVAGAIFESASGFTTTGASVMKDVTAWPRGVLLWRATTQWLGGMGILVLIVAVLSMVGAGSKSLFRRESSAKFSEGFSTRVRETALRLWQIYVALTAVCTIGLVVLGMPVFDSVCHTFAAISTGGFSTRNESIMYYHSPAIEWWLIAFMILGAINFMLYAWLLVGRWNRWRQDEETRAFLWILIGVSLLIAADIIYFGQADGWADGFRAAAFQAVSVMTTTGFASADFDQWPNFSRGLLVALMFIGGCAGSTAGGVKVGRVVVFFKTLRRQMVHSFRPNQIIPVRINNVNVSDSYLLDVMFFLALTGVIVALATLAMAVLEPQFSLLSSFTAVAATLFNIGPGLDAVGPMMNYAGLGAAAHLLLSGLMIMGRLEIFAVLVLFVPLLWRRF
ncbi:MAG: TrkH family potassium uptake protein [Chthoniobacterales bacterium]|nr:TrkH family potassium uptake protein [Chthoniobacterales bacterium]